MSNIIKLVVFISLLLALKAHPQKTTEHSKIMKTSHVKDLAQTYSHIYTEVFNKINQFYVDDINKKNILRRGIQGLMEPLDPYSKVLMGSRKAHYELLTKGSYGGVGMHLSNIKGILTILSTIPNSPARKARLKAGDQILEIDNRNIKNSTVTEAANLIKGKLNSIVTLKIKRPHENKFYTVELIRQKILIHDLPYADLIDENIFYIKLRKFSKHISHDFKKTLERSNKKHLQGIIIDLRGNSGGLLSSALKLLDDIIEKDNVILKIKGKYEKYNEIKKSKNHNFLSQKTKLIILIDEISASASEIVAGTLQDLDRAVIIGKTSFGKGLVQKIYKINKEINIKLTTSRYYTPSGRLIQKKKFGKNKQQEKPKEILKFKTSRGRDVTANGGITPDIIIEQRKIPQFIKVLEKQRIFLLFAASYNKLYSLRFPLAIDNSIIKEFKKFIQDYDIKYTLRGEKELSKIKLSLESLNEFYDTNKNKKLSKNIENLESYFQSLKKNPFDYPLIKEWVKRRLNEKINRVLFGKSEEIKQSLIYDKVFQEAIKLIQNDKNYYKILAPKSVLK